MFRIDRVMLVRSLLWVLARVPLPVLHALGFLTGTLLAVRASRPKRDSAVNLALCLPELNESQRGRLLTQSLRELGKSLFEVAAFWYRSPAGLEALVKEVHGAELLEQAHAAGNGVIVAVPHLGAWELLGSYFSRRVPLHMLYRPPRRPEFEPLLREARERQGGQAHPATGAGIRSLYKALGRGDVIAILPDQEPKEGGVYAPFFGVPALTMSLLSKLAQRSQAPVLYAYAERLPRGRGFRVVFVSAPAAVADPDPVVAVTALNRGLEECVRRAPAQYQWSYRRFRHPPEGGNPYR
jgi:Kdo2-lipid IVA lauroyltransferase/acyltransferase